MKNVTIIGDFCYPNFMGGSSKHVYDLICNLPTDVVDWNLITRRSSKSNEYSADEIEAQTKFDSFKRNRRIKEVSVLNIFNPLTYLNKIRKSQYVVLQHPVMGLFGAILGRCLHKKVIYHYHGPLHIEYYMKSGKRGLHYNILWLMQKLTVMLSQMVLTHSSYMKSISQREHSVPDNKSINLPPYIERVESDVKLPYFKDDNKIKLLIPRRLTARTGIIEFLKAFLIFPEDFRNKFHIYISGKGELQSKVESLVKQDSQNIQYIGFISYNELWSLYTKVDAVVVPTLDLEGFGYIILEAMSCGAMPLVSKTCGGGFEFVEKHLGSEYVFDIYSPKSIQDTLSIITQYRNNRNKYMQIASVFSTKNMIKTYLEKILK